MNSKKDTILVVDDVPANLGVLFNTLEEANYKVLITVDGRSALTNIHDNPPDLVLLDVMMPDLDGFEVCRRLKANPATQDIPLIFMTALNDPVDEVKGFELGAVDYITKPIQLERALARIKTHLTMRKLQIGLQQKNAELAEALAKVKTLRDMLPICANCKKIRDDEGYWQEVEVYVYDHIDVTFSHGICPDCMQALYPEYWEQSQRKADDEVSE